MILGETAVEQNANTRAIYHTGIDDFENMTTSPGAVGVSLYRYLRRYQYYYGDCVYQHGGETLHDDFLFSIYQCC